MKGSLLQFSYPIGVALAAIGSGLGLGRAVGSAMEATSRNIGIAFGTGIIMLLFALNMGTAQITPETYPAFTASIDTAYMIFAVLCFVALMLSALRGTSSTGYVEYAVD